MTEEEKAMWPGEKDWMEQPQVNEGRLAATSSWSSQKWMYLDSPEGASPANTLTSPV